MTSRTGPGLPIIKGSARQPTLHAQPIIAPLAPYRLALGSCCNLRVDWFGRTQLSYIVDAILP
jgi:hypothetical protein